MAAGHVYHWKHGWIPLTHFAALQKAHGSQSGAVRYLHASHSVHGSHSPGEYRGGVHSGMAAARTYGVLSRKGLGVGSTVYWHHPGTGKQVQAKIVGIEHTGHIIVQHSGNKNALIGHTTYSPEPWANVPFQDAGSFRNPHIHTRVLERDAHGNPIYPKGYKPPTSRPSSRKGTTVFEKSYPATKTHETAPRVDAKPNLTPTAPEFKPLPHEFTPIDPKTITPYHTISAMARMKEGSKIRHAYQMGPHKVLIQSAMTEQARQGLLNDIKDTLHQAHPTLGEHGVTFLVPTGERQFRTRSNGSTVLGFVIRGGSTVHINPKVANGTHESIAGKESFMAAAKNVGTRRYTLTHELGHVVDNMNHTTRSDRQGQFHEGVQHFLQNRHSLSAYGSHSITEGYAEAFAQHQLGNDSQGKQHAIANEYARIYGWKKA